jgi:hypothetical protein
MLAQPRRRFIHVPGAKLAWQCEVTVQAHCNCRKGWKIDTCRKARASLYCEKAVHANITAQIQHGLAL